MVNPYDEIDYPGFAYAATHPDRLATLATLFRMEPPSVETCRVLELGCGDGANIIPIAYGLPHSACVGVDVAARPIERARSAAAALALTNVSFQCLDVTSLGPDAGEFDYIIAHGLYSWVGPDIRDRILDVCARNLAPTGVAFVSYNAYPGGHLRELARHMMQFHVRAIPEPARQVTEGLALLKWVKESTVSDELRGVLEHELAKLGERAAAVIYHDDLASTYQPVYFYDFIDHARRHGLQYLAEADFGSMQGARFPDPVSEVLRRVEDVISKEQLQDFLKGRGFRQTLLCHDDVRLDRSGLSHRLYRLRVASPARPTSAGEDLRAGVSMEFRTPEGRAMSTNHPVVKAAMVALGESWPRSIAFLELETMAITRAGGVPTGGESPSLAEMVLAMYAGAIVELRRHEPRFAIEVAHRPAACALARWQLQTGSFVTTLRHTTIKLDDSLLRGLVSLLDGTRDEPALLSALTELIRTGGAKLERDGRMITTAEEIQRVLASELPRALAELAQLALLVE